MRARIADGRAAVAGERPDTAAAGARSEHPTIAPRAVGSGHADAPPALDLVTAGRARRPPRAGRRGRARLPRRPRAPRQHSTAGATRATASTRSPRGSRRYLELLGGVVTRHPDPDGVLGDTVEAVFEGEPGGPRAILLGHTDTVFPEGTAAERPFAIRDGIATGPGVTDMKSGLLTLLYGLEAALAAGPLPFERLTVIANPDEEIGSPSSTPPRRARRPGLRRRLQPRVRPGERRHRLVAQGDGRLRDHGPRPRRPRRRRAGEGAQRDPRGGAPRRSGSTR